MEPSSSFPNAEMNPFRLPPPVAGLFAEMRPVPRPLFSAFRDYRMGASGAQSVQFGFSHASRTVGQGETHDIIHLFG
jgi:hypothetical protein